jgi:hypothetical protein
MNEVKVYLNGATTPRIVPARNGDTVKQFLDYWYPGQYTGSDVLHNGRLITNLNVTLGAGDSLNIAI